MTSMFSILVAVAMIFSSIGGLTGAVEEPVSFEASVSVDGEMISALTAISGAATESAEDAEGSDAAQPDMGKAIGDLLSAVTIKGVAANGAAELGLFADQDVLLSIGSKNTEEGTLLASSLLGNLVLSVTNEEMQQMLSAMVPGTSDMNVQDLMAKLGQLDWDQLLGDVTGTLEPMLATLQEKNGDPETGAYSVDGLTFAVKVPVNMTYDELMELLLQTAKELVAKESVQSLAQLVAPDQDLSAAVDTAIENWKNLPDEAKYDLAIAMYSDENGSAYFACDVERKGAEDGSVQADSLHLGAGQVGNGVEAHVKATQGALDMTVTTAEDGSTEIQAQITAEEMAADINEKHAADGSSETTIQATAQGMPLTIHIVEAVENEQKVAQVEVFLMGMENPLVTVHCVSGKGGEFVSVFEGADITTVTMEQLGSTEDTTLAGQLQMNLISGLMQGIMTLGQHVPEDTALWLNTQLANMMSPDASTVTEGE